MSDLNHIRKNRKLKKEQNRSRSVTNLFSKRQAIQSEQKTDIIENETSKRYHPKKKELVILNKGLNCYYSLKDLMREI